MLFLGFFMADLQFKKLLPPSTHYIPFYPIPSRCLFERKETILLVHREAYGPVIHKLSKFPVWFRSEASRLAEKVWAPNHADVQDDHWRCRAKTDHLMGKHLGESTEEFAVSIKSALWAMQGFQNPLILQTWLIHIGSLICWSLYCS